MLKFIAEQRMHVDKEHNKISIIVKVYLIFLHNLLVVAATLTETSWCYGRCSRSIFGHDLTGLILNTLLECCCVYVHILLNMIKREKCVFYLLYKFALKCLTFVSSQKFPWSYDKLRFHNSS